MDAKRITDIGAENREVKRANEILLAASSLFAPEPDTTTAVMTAFVTCQHLVDQIKARTPIRKRQYLSDGTSQWVGL